MAHRHVLLIGWRPDAVEALHRLGAEVTCVVAAHELPAVGALLDDAHTVVAGDPYATEPTLAALAREGLSADRFDVVTSQFEYSLVNAAVVGGARSRTSPEQALLLRDKALQKRRIRAAGLPVADSALVTRPAALHGFALSRGVLKPLDLSAGRGVRTWADDAGRALLAETLADSPTPGPWLAESWVDGTELHLDGVVRAGRVRFVSVGRYLQNPLAVHTGGPRGSLMEHPDHDPSLYDRAGAFADRAMAALDHHDGVFHLEVYEQPDGTWVFGECGGRIAGGSIDVMVRLQHGVDLHEEWARAVLGLPPTPARPAAVTSFGHVFLAAPGPRCALPGLPEIAARPGVRHTAAQPPPPAPAARLFPATAVVEGKDPRHTSELVHDLADWFDDRCVPASHPADARPLREETP
ncbi:acetyl-CoA carboxylase biotin carboxylase subunit family protein [Streptomyces sp. NBC_01171]|uniref:ATP-grasp domain-containing protein n=1 Tax=Streptomyces sp. NBC_01171 TaxID=2903757 RepID=UPI0038656903|nr:hypothetical protein OG448_14895 [Streptomyces sp. NBC_01171]